MLTALKIATRKSPLALHQANFVRGRLLELYPAIDIALLKVRTQGDRYLDTPLGGKGLFEKKRILIFRGAGGRPLTERLCKRVGHA